MDSADQAATTRAVEALESPEEVCARLEACCHVALPLMGSECDESQLVDHRSTQMCINGLGGVRALLDRTGYEWPDECR